MTRRGLAVVLLALVACTHAQHEPADADDLRARWFVERRAFPFAEIPAGARREAIAELRRVASESTGSWMPVGNGSISVIPPYAKSNGRINAVAVSPIDPRIILIGSSGGGIFRSTDGGATFVPVTDDQADIGVGDIAFASADIVYAGMGDPISDITLGGGVLRSDDAGATWRHVSTGELVERGAIRQLVTDPADPEHLLILQVKHLAPTGPAAGGIFESRDGARTWTSLMFGVFNSLLRIDATTLVVGLGTRILRSTDGGAHWSSVISRLGDVFVARASDPSLVYATSTGETSVQLLVSRDAGATWQTSSANGLEADKSPFNYLVVSPTDSRTLYRGMRDLWRSTDGGANWTNLTNNWTGETFHSAISTMHTDQHAIAFASDGATWLATDGGLYVSRDGVRTFTFAGPRETSVIQLYGITADAVRIYGGTQDNGLITTTGNGWSERQTGDYGSILIDPNNPQRFLSNYTQGEFYLFNSNGTSTRLTTNDTFDEPKKSTRIAFIAPLVMNRTTSSIYFATWRLYVSHDFGSNWTLTAATDLTTGIADYVSAIGITEGNANVIYTGSARGKVMRSTNGGATWTDITAGLPQRSVSSIVTTGDGSTAWIAFSGYQAGHVYRTTDAGATWVRVDAGLPDLPVDTLYLDGTTMWAGTDVGPFRLNDDGMWRLIGGGMPAVIVMAFARTPDGRLLAATHGRGVYEFVPAAASPPRRRALR